MISQYFVGNLVHEGEVPLPPFFQGLTTPTTVTHSQGGTWLKRSSSICRRLSVRRHSRESKEVSNMSVEEGDKLTNLPQEPAKTR